MHDKRGREIGIGDDLKIPCFKDNVPSKQIAKVIALHPGSDTCNVTVVYATEWYGVQNTLTNANETEIVLKANGSEPEEPDLPKKPVGENISE